MSEKRDFQELVDNVISTDKCAGCGACFVVCPYKGVLEYVDEEPKLVGECKKCDVCLRVCPRYETSMEEMEDFVFDRKRTAEESFGVYRGLFMARSTDKKILERCQDGGLVTSLLVGALESGIIDGAIVSGVDPAKPWLPIPLVAKTREEIIENAGTRYSYSPNLLAIKEALSSGLKKIGFVGTPCQIQAIRKIQMVPLRKYAKAISFTVGLFCTESFSYEGLMIEKIQRDLGLNLEDVSKINIKGKLLVYMENGEVHKISLKEAKLYSRPKCQDCDDFSAELADISAGGIGLESWTMAIVRTDRGAEVFENAVDKGLIEVKKAEEFKSSLNLLVKLSKSKQRRATLKNC